MKLPEAQKLAERLVSAMRPHCERVEIAGSIRRQNSVVKDIEIVAIPKWEQVPDVGDLLGERTIATNLLHGWAMRHFEKPRGIYWIKPGTKEIISWAPKADGRYWRATIGDIEPVKLDLFLCTAKNWGTIQLIRTGSADFSAAVATHAKNIGRNFADGYTTISGLPIDTLEEADVFRALNLQWVPPQARLDGRQVQPLRGEL